jgi:hypothetical protein
MINQYCVLNKIMRQTYWMKDEKYRHETQQLILFTVNCALILILHSGN